MRRASKPTGMSRYYLGLDLGQAADYSALVILEELCGKPFVDEMSGRIVQPEPYFHARHLQRWKLGTGYPSIVTDVGQIVARPELQLERVNLAIDQTGVGRPVVDLFRAAKLRVNLLPITITGGDAVTSEGDSVHVPKRDLVACVQVSLQTRRLRIAASLPEARILTTELQNFQVKIDPLTAHDSYGAWREGAHDDLVLAVALALWNATRYAVKQERRGGILHRALRSRGI